MQGYGPVNQGAKGGYHISQQKKRLIGKCNFSRYIYQLGANQLIL